MMNEIITVAPSLGHLTLRVSVGAGLWVGVGAGKAPGKLGSGRTLGDKPRNLEGKRGS